MKIYHTDYKTEEKSGMSKEPEISYNHSRQKKIQYKTQNILYSKILPYRLSHNGYGNNNLKAVIIGKCSLFQKDWMIHE
jgi:hypothetical protein